MLDLSQARQEALDFAKRRDPEGTHDVIATHTNWDIGYVVARNGDVYALNQDGVGNSKPVSKTNPVMLHFYPDVPGKINTVPIVSAPADKDALLDLPVETEVNLADFIRTFGSRLERNYDEWREKLEPLV